MGESLISEISKIEEEMEEENLVEEEDVAIGEDISEINEMEEEAANAARHAARVEQLTRKGLEEMG